MTRKRWKPGDRVVRKVYLDDGTWAKRGDACLSKSPLKHGTVTRRSRIRGEVYVEWDSGEIRTYQDHGLDAEP